MVLALGGVDKPLEQQFLEVEVRCHISQDIRTTEDDLQPLQPFRSPVDDGGAGVGEYLHRRVARDELVERTPVKAFEARPADAKLRRFIQERVLEQRVRRRVVIHCQRSIPNFVSQLQVVLPSTIPDCSSSFEWKRYYGTGDYSTTFARQET